MYSSKYLSNEIPLYADINEFHLSMIEEAKEESYIKVNKKEAIPK